MKEKEKEILLLDEKKNEIDGFSIYVGKQNLLCNHWNLTSYEIAKLVLYIIAFNFYSIS